MSVTKVLDNVVGQYEATLEHFHQEVRRVQVKMMAYRQAADKLKASILVVAKALDEKGLTIQTANIVNEGRELLIRAVPKDKSFKFVKFQGYAKSGAGRNQRALNTKASQIEIHLARVVDGLRVHVNAYSLESKVPETANSVLITLTV